MKERIITPNPETEDLEEVSLRPKQLSEFVGQSRVRQTLNVCIEAACKRGEPLDHVLLYGPPGLGKTTLAHIIAREMGGNIQITSGPAIERPGDLAAILTNLGPGDILFIDEIHRLSRIVEEILYPGMEDYALDIVIGKGPGARSLRLNLPRFTLVGATTRAGQLTSPLRDRFGVVERLEFYGHQELETIIVRGADILKTRIDSPGAREIARRSRGTPRVANRLLKRVRDYVEVRAGGVIDAEKAKEALNFLGIDALGLDFTDRCLLGILIERFNGGPVGLDTLAAATNEESVTLEDVSEPYLLQQGLLARTSRGRVATSLAFKHLGYEIPARTEQKRLWEG